jgi:hypothetical protein
MYTQVQTLPFLGGSEVHGPHSPAVEHLACQNFRMSDV